MTNKINHLLLSDAHFSRVQSVLSGLAPRALISTRDLVERTWPGAVEPCYTYRKELYSLLRYPPETLAPYFTRGAAVKGRFGNQVRPYLWHAPRQVCRACGGTGFAGHAPVIAADPVWTA